MLTLVSVVVEKPAFKIPPPAAGPPTPVAELPPIAWLRTKELFVTASDAPSLQMPPPAASPTKPFVPLSVTPLMLLPPLPPLARLLVNWLLLTVVTPDSV